MSSKKRRRRFTAEQKATIMRRMMFEQVPVSDLAEEYRIEPSQLYHWQKQVQANLEAAFVGDGLDERRSSSDDLGPKAPQDTVVLGPTTLAEMDFEVIMDERTVGEDMPTAPERSTVDTTRQSRIERSDDSLMGGELGGYRIARKLAEGGVGVVYLGEHHKIGKRAAIKVLKSQYCDNKEIVERFYREARVVNEIRHDNIVDIFHFGRHCDGRVFFAMELLEGEALHTCLRARRMPWGEVLAITRQIIRALAAAHDKGVVHRDLKPENIFLHRTDRGRQVKILDFGIAKLVDGITEGRPLTRTGAFFGTPHYMSPEQIAGRRNVDQRSDIYSLGVIMYEMVEGRLPFRGDTLTKIVGKHMFVDPPPMATMTPGTPAVVELCVHRMLAKEQAARYQSVLEVLSDLEDVDASRPPSFAAAQDVHSPPMVRPPRDARSSVAHPGWRLTVIAAAAALVGALAYLVLRPDTRADSVPPTRLQRHASPTGIDPRPVDSFVNRELAAKHARALMIGALDAPDSAVRAQACDAVGYIKDMGAVSRLQRLAEGDPASQVRGRAARALAEFGASRSTMRILAEVTTRAEPELLVHYAYALARLGSRKAKRTLSRLTSAPEPQVALAAAVALADSSEHGDRRAVRGLHRLNTRMSEAMAVEPHARVVITSRLAAHGDRSARRTLYEMLQYDDMEIRIAAAQELSRDGDEEGKEVLHAAMLEGDPYQRATAARSLVAVGDYSGYEIMHEGLSSENIEVRRECALGLGEIGENSSLRALVELQGVDPDLTVRLAAATSVLVIVALDPTVLAQTSVAWVRSALGSEDWAIRYAAAGTLGALPERQATPLLARALFDRNASVRAAAANSAARIKTAEVAEKVALAARVEKIVTVKEEQVLAMGKLKIKTSVLEETLLTIADESNRPGVLALGALIAIGNTDALPRLERASSDRSPLIRQAAMEAASLADDRVVVLTLRKGVSDSIFGVRFAAAEGLAHYRTERLVAVPVLQEGLRDTLLVVGRARAALLRLGVSVDRGESIARMLESRRASVRAAAIPAIVELAWSDARPLLSRTIFDSVVEVKRAAVDALESFVDKHAPEVARLYKLLVNDRDPVSRAKARAQLSRLGGSASLSHGTASATGKRPATEDEAVAPTGKRPEGEDGDSPSLVRDAKVPRVSVNNVIGHGGGAQSREQSGQAAVIPHEGIAGSQYSSNRASGRGESTTRDVTHSAESKEVLGKNAIQSVLTARREQINLLCGPWSSGPARHTVLLAVRVQNNGSVESVIVRNNPETDVARCVAASVEEMKFPATGGETAFEYPFIVESSNEIQERLHTASNQIGIGCAPWDLQPHSAQPVVLAIQVNGDGSVASTSVRNNADNVVASCVARVIAQVKFPATLRRRTFEHRFNVAPSKETKRRLLGLQRRIGKSCMTRESGREERVLLTVQVAPNGSVQRTSVRMSPDQHSGDCVADIVARSTFPMSPEGRTFEYSVPIEFLGRDDVQRIMQEARKQVARCRDPHEVTGQIVLSIDVEPGGTVRAVEVRESPNEELGHCIKNAVMQLVFPSTPTGLSFQYPYVLK